MILQKKIKPPSRSENTKKTPLISFKKISWSRHITLQGIHIRDWFLVLSEKSNWWQIDPDQWWSSSLVGSGYVRWAVVLCNLAWFPLGSPSAPAPVPCLQHQHHCQRWCKNSFAQKFKLIDWRRKVKSLFFLVFKVKMPHYIVIQH